MAKVTKTENQATENAHKSVQVFDNEMFGALRVVVTDDQKTLFNLADVCRALEIKNPRDAKTRLQKRGVVTADTPTTNQHGAVVMQPMTYIDEANLYRCIFQSRKAEAEKFQSWVFEEVLPQIRKTGGYIPTKDSEGRLLTEEQIVEQAMGILGRTLATANANNTHCFTATEVARSWGMDVRSFNKVLSRMGVQYRRGGRWLLADELKDRHLSEDRFYLGFSLKGSPKLSTYLTWTSEGVRYLNSRFLNSGNGQHAIQLNVFIDN